MAEGDTFEGSNFRDARERLNFRDARARLAAAVVVLATTTATGLRGMTVTTLTPLSLEPAQLLVSLDSRAAARDTIVESGTFTANLLARDQQFTADRFAGLGPAPDPRWIDIPHRLLPGGLPVLTGCNAWFLCQVTEVHPAGDHDLVLASVTEWGGGDGEPLIYWGRDYWSLAPT